MIRPPRLSPGDRVAVIAPAGPVPEGGFAAGRARLGDRYKLLVDDGLFARRGYLAGDDGRRAAELERALEDAEVRAILCARGGYGIMRLLDRLDDAQLARAPRVLAGFSDVTALHAAFRRAGVASLHGPTVAQLGALPPSNLEALFALLESPSPPPPWRDLRAVAPGRAEGRALGGNLELVTRLLGTPWQLPLDGAVLFLEEVGERPYRIDRQLTQLQLAGATRVAAVVLGDLVHCEERESDGPSGLEVAVERLSGWGVPVVAGAPFGHGERNLPFPIGARVAVDAERGVVEFLEGLVA
jgi:muramoyltetrapeptide carboxypeptidase